MIQELTIAYRCLLPFLEAVETLKQECAIELCDPDISKPQERHCHAILDACSALSVKAKQLDKIING